jgi:hypothetical protein
MKYGSGSLDIGRFPEPACRAVTCCRKTGGVEVLLMLGARLAFFTFYSETMSFAGLSFCSLNAVKAERQEIEVPSRHLYRSSDR